MSEKDLVAIHEESLREFDAVWSVVREERQQSLEDRRFYSISGAMWEGDFGEDYGNKPKPEINKVNLAVMRIISEYRNNRITANFVSKYGDAADETADLCDGLYRADEQDSGAEEAYDCAFEESVGGGFGAWRLRAEYEDEYDEDNEQQRVRLEPITDADQRVFFDIDARRQDKADATRGWILTPMARATYEDKYGDNVASWPNGIENWQYDWSTPDVVYIAEYYLVEDSTETVLTYRKVTGEEVKFTQKQIDANPEEIKLIKKLGAKKIKERKVKRKKVCKYILNGNEVLEDCGYIAGTEIPVVVTYGKRWFVDNIERFSGHVRYAKDPVRIKNSLTGMLLNVAVRSPQEKPVFFPEQIDMFANEWAEDSKEDRAYLRMNPMMSENGEAITGPAYVQKPPPVPPALAALIQLVDSDLREILGGQEQGEQIRSNLSGDAVELIQAQLSMQTYIYMSNFAKAIKRCAEIWLGMAKDIMVEPNRKAKVIGSMGQVDAVTLNQKQDIDGALEIANDLSKAKLEVVGEVGPASNSQRSTIKKSILEMIQYTSDPQDIKVLTAFALMNEEGEGTKDIREYYRNQLLQMGAVTPTDEEAKKLAEAKANRPPNSQDQYFEAAANEANTKAVKNQSDAALNVAKAEKYQAETAETIAGIDRNDRQQVIETAEKIADSLTATSQPTMTE